MRNIELKARKEHLAAALLTCSEIGATAHGEIHQTDTYFCVPEGRLKLREAHPGRCELIFYRRPDVPGPKGCDYTLYPTSPDIKAFLQEALGVLAVVAKKRKLYLWENVRIHLDEVQGLGTFIEFEAVLPENADPSKDDAKGHQQLVYLMNAFDIDAETCETGSYLDLTLAAQG